MSSCENIRFKTIFLRNYLKQLTIIERYYQLFSFF